MLFDIPCSAQPNLDSNPSHFFRAGHYTVRQLLFQGIYSIVRNSRNRDTAGGPAAVSYLPAISAAAPYVFSAL